MITDIVYFDYWTRGVRHFSSIDPYLKSRGFKTTLVHMGSLRGEEIVNDQIISGIKCLDLCFFCNNPVKMLLALRPKVVLLLNNQTEDRIIIRACRNIGIKTIFLMHGTLLTTAGNLNSKEAISNSIALNAELLDSAFGIRARLERIPKYFRLLLCYYHAAELKSKRSFFSSDILLYLFRHLISPGSNICGKYIYQDSFADHALVYSQDDKNHYVEAHGWPSSRVNIVGNYNLDPLYDLSIAHNDIAKRNYYAVYIENGFSDPKFTVPGWSEAAVANEVIAMANILSRYGYNLVLKLHPSSDYNDLPRLVSPYCSIIVVENCNLAELISMSDLVIAQSSSVLMMPVVLSKPIVIPDISPLRLGESKYARRGIGTIVQTYDEFSSCIENILTKPICTQTQLKDIESFAGPFDGKATQRIANFLISVLYL